MKKKLKIERIFAYVATDPEDGSEGVCSMQIGQVHFPMVGADMERMKFLWPKAEALAHASGMEIRLMLFDNAQVIDTIKPLDG